MIIIWQGRQTPVDQYGILDWRVTQDQSGVATIHGAMAATAGNASTSEAGKVLVTGHTAPTAGAANTNETGKVLVSGSESSQAGNASSAMAGTVQNNTRTGSMSCTAGNASCAQAGTSGSSGGSIKRRHSKRYEWKPENGPVLIAGSIPALHAKIAQWRAQHPQTPAIQQPALELIKVTVKVDKIAITGATEPSASSQAALRPGFQEAPGNSADGAPVLLDLYNRAVLADAAQRDREQQLRAALAEQMRLEDEEDMEALMLILEKAA